jgi:MoaA/NifB/PqqE/SkfB family radical SAM enzyme
MKLKLIKYAAAVAKNDLLIKVGKHTHKCINHPYLIYFSVTYRCNAKCITCLRWKNTFDDEELSLNECKDIIRQLHNWVGSCNVTFSGGEPFIKDGFLQLLQFTNKLNILTNVSTNGLELDEKMCDEIIKTNVDSLIFSLNSIDPMLHNYYKGSQYAHQKVISAIQYIKRKKNRPRLGVLCIISRDTYKTLNKFAEWAHGIGADSVDFQPILCIQPPELYFESPLSKSLYSIPLAQIDNLNLLDEQIDLLIKRKKEGLPIVLPIKELERVKIYFRNLNQLTNRYCTVGFRNLYITHRGDVQLCPWFPPVGNIRKETLPNIWTSNKAKNQRLALLSCAKPCLAGCMREYGIKEKLTHFFILGNRDKTSNFNNL